MSLSISYPPHLGAEDDDDDDAFDVGDDTRAYVFSPDAVRAEMARQMSARSPSPSRSTSPSPRRSATPPPGAGSGRNILDGAKHKEKVRDKDIDECTSISTLDIDAASTRLSLDSGSESPSTGMSGTFSQISLDTPVDSSPPNHISYTHTQSHQNYNHSAGYGFGYPSPPESSTAVDRVDGEDDWAEEGGGHTRQNTWTYPSTNGDSNPNHSHSRSPSHPRSRSRSSSPPSSEEDVAQSQPPPPPRPHTPPTPGLVAPPHSAPVHTFSSTSSPSASGSGSGPSNHYDVRSPPYTASGIASSSGHTYARSASPTNAIGVRGRGTSPGHSQRASYDGHRTPGGSSNGNISGSSNNSNSNISTSSNVNTNANGNGSATTTAAAVAGAAAAATSSTLLTEKVFPPRRGGGGSGGKYKPSAFEKVMSKTRPTFLPPKPKEEDKKHMADWQAMMNQSRIVAEKRRLALQQRRIAREQAIEDSLSIWESEILPDWRVVHRNPALRRLWWQGIPTKLRAPMWERAVGNELALSKDHYRTCLSRAKRALTSGVFPQPTLDLLESDIASALPSLHLFSPNPESPGPMYSELRDMLCAWVVARSDEGLGYTKGAAKIAAMLLVNMPAQPAFVVMRNLLERHCLRSFYGGERARDDVEAYYRIFDTMLADGMPKIYFNFKQHQISPASYLADWALPLFLDHLPFEACARVWDVLLLEGDSFVFRAALGVLAVLEPRLFFPERRELLELLRGENKAAIDVAKREGRALDGGRYEIYGVDEETLWARIEGMNEWWKDSTWTRLIQRELPDL